MNFLLCVVALLNVEILPRITIHEYRLASRSNASTKIATGPMWVIMPASSPNPCEVGAPVPAPPSACKKHANGTIKIAIHLILHGTRLRSPAQVTLWVPLQSLSHCLSRPRRAAKVAPASLLTPRSCYAALGFSSITNSVVKTDQPCSSNCALKTTPSSITPLPPSAPASTSSPAKPAPANPSSSTRSPSS